MRLAYADPPYPGMSHFYREDPRCSEVNHEILIGSLERDYDGWALNTASTTLHVVLPLCPPGTRIAAWVKPFASFKPGVSPAYAWEPVLFKPARSRARVEPTVRDWIAEPITLQRGLTGAKPLRVCLWVLEIIGDESGDEVDDLFPGTGLMSEAVRLYGRQRDLFSRGAA